MTIKEKVKKIIGIESVQHALTLITGSVIAQAISLVFYPIITRLYTPSEFGTFTTFLSIAGFLVVLSTLGYHYSIIVPKGLNRSTNCIYLSICSVLLITLICCFSIPFSTDIALFFNNINLSTYISLLPLYCLIGGLWSVLNYTLIRNKLFKNISQYNISLSLSNSIFKCGFGVLNISGGLIWGQLIGMTTSLITTLISTIKKLPFIKRFDKKEILDTALTYKRFPKYSTSRDLINYLCANLLIIGLSPYYDSTSIGLIGLAMAISSRPINLIIVSLQQTFAQKISNNIHNNLPVGGILLEYLKYAAPITIVGAIIISLIIVPICEFLFGEEWSEVGFIIILNLPRYVAHILAYPFDSAPNLTGNQKTDFFIENIKVLVSVCAIIIGIYLKGLYTTIILYSIALTIIATIRGIFYYRILKQHDARMFVI